MRLSLQTSNILHQMLEPEVNIIYQPRNNIFDQLLYMLDFNFFVFDENYTPFSTNCRSINASYVDLHCYDLFVCNGIMNMAQNHINRQMHVNTVAIEHSPKFEHLKKEDVAIINNKHKKTKKIFFNENSMKSWGLHNSIHTTYGIPLNINNNNIEYNDRKDLLMHQTKNHMIDQHLANLPDLLKLDKGSCSFLDMNSLPIEEVIQRFNNHKVVINLEDNPIIDLLALSCGCNVYTGRVYQPSIMGLNPISSIQDVLMSYEATAKVCLDKSKIVEFIQTHFSFDVFKIKISEIFQTHAKREAFIL